MTDYNVPIKIGDWVQRSNTLGDWSDSWFDSYGHHIVCPHCGCSTVTPVPLDEYAELALEDNDQETKNEGIRRMHEKHQYTNLVPDNNVHEEYSEEFPHGIDYDDNVNYTNDLEKYHRKHGVFACGNENCADHTCGPYFSPTAKPDPKPADEIKTWDSSTQRSSGYNNPWGPMATTIPRKGE